MSSTPGSPRRRRYVVGISGASGAILGVRLLERLRDLDAEVHLVVSPWGARTLEHETPYSVADVRKLADVVHRPSDQAATISSGSFRTDGMIIAPCSVKTVAAIASGYGEDLLTRAADVHIKERRPLVLVVREMPLSAIHLENMLKLARLGVSIVPPVLGFYQNPESLDDVVAHVVTRVLDQVGVSSDDSEWSGVLRRRI